VLSFLSEHVPLIRVGPTRGHIKACRTGLVPGQKKRASSMSSVLSVHL
jgi:hypothetical protein